MKFRPAVVLIFSAACIAGCAQAPQPGEITTGSILPSLPSTVSELLPSAQSLLPSLPASSTPNKPERIGANLYRISTDDRRIDDTTQRENYALLRAAEVTKNVGATHFIVVNASGPSSVVVSPAQPQLSTMIRTLRLERGAEPPIGAVSADEMVHFFGPAFGREAGKLPS